MFSYFSQMFNYVIEFPVVDLCRLVFDELVGTFYAFLYVQLYSHMGYGPELSESSHQVFSYMCGYYGRKKKSHQLAKSKNIIDLDNFTDR